MFDLSTEELDEINKAQRVVALRTMKAMKLNPPWKQCYPGQKIKGEIKPFPFPDDILEPLNDEVFNQWFEEYVSPRPRMGPPYVTKGIGSHISSDEEIKPFKFPISDNQWAYLEDRESKKRRLKMFGKRKERTIATRVVEEMIRRRLREHREEWHYPPQNYTFKGVEIELYDLLEKILNHLGITLKVTPEKTELVAVKKKKRLRKSVSKSRKSK